MAQLFCKHCGKAKTKTQLGYRCLHCMSMKKHGIDAVCDRHQVIMHVDGPFKRWSTKINDYRQFYKTHCAQCDSETIKARKRDVVEEQHDTGPVAVASDNNTSPIEAYKRRMAKLSKRERDLQKLLLGRW